MNDCGMYVARKEETFNDTVDVARFVRTLLTGKVL